MDTNTTIIILAAWLLFLSVVVFWLLFFLRSFFPHKKRGLSKLMDDLLQKGEKNEKEQMALLTKLLKLEEDGALALHKTGLVRFNPFDRIGGEQSYVLALLNKKNSGVVVTFFYTKEGVRVYVKQVAGGKGVGAELSKEEEKAIAKAE